MQSLYKILLDDFATHSTAVIFLMMHFWIQKKHFFQLKDLILALFSDLANWLTCGYQ